MCWATDVALQEVLTAADRLRRTRGGQDLPAWGEPERAAKGGSGRLSKAHPAAAELAAGPRAPAGKPASQDPANRDPEDPDPGIQDSLAEDELAMSADWRAGFVEGLRMAQLIIDRNGR